MMKAFIQISLLFTHERLLQRQKVSLEFAEFFFREQFQDWLVKNYVIDGYFVYKSNSFVDQLLIGLLPKIKHINQTTHSSLHIIRVQLFCTF